MANPQIEEGHTRIANDILDNLISANLSGQEMRVALLVIRKTYGFNKKEDFISLSQMMAALGISKTRASQVVNSLGLMKILTVTENINGMTKKYRFNKDFDQWNTVKENLNRYGKTKGTVKVLRNRPLRKTLTTKDTITKDTITKAKNEFVLPDWIPQETWSAYMAVREKKRAAKTPYALNLVITELQKIKKTHNHDPVEVLNKSITSGWTDVYPLKDGGQNGIIRTPKIYHRQEQVVSARQREIDAEAERLSKEYYALQAKGNPTNGSA